MPLLRPRLHSSAPAWSSGPPTTPATWSATKAGAVTGSPRADHRCGRRQYTTYALDKFTRFNQGTSINQRPIVTEGQRIEVGQVLADGPSTDQGELALGKNLLVAFMSWEGHNYVRTRSSFPSDSSKTTCCPAFTSKSTKSMPATPSSARKRSLGTSNVRRGSADLDERGIIRIGADVVPGDILVGKVTPSTELTPEERLLRAIFMKGPRGSRHVTESAAR